MGKLLIYTAHLLLISMQVIGQQAEQYSFLHLSTANGLASNHVYNVVEDYRGYIWLATMNGLQRYDGNKFLTFQSSTANKSTLPANCIFRVYEDYKRNLWVMTNDGKIGIFNTSSFTYRETPIVPTNAKNTFTDKCIFEDKAGTLYLLFSSGETFRFNERVNAFEDAADSIPCPKGWKRWQIIQDFFTNRYWMACDSGVAVFDPATRHLNYKGNNIDHDPVIESTKEVGGIYKLYADRKNRLWFITWPSTGGPIISYCDLFTGKQTVYSLAAAMGLGYHEIVAVLEQQNGRTWVYGMPFLCEYTGGIKPFHAISNRYTNEQSIQFDNANNLYEDKKQNIWVSTNNGVFLVNPDRQFFSSYNLLRPGDKKAAQAAVIVARQLVNGQIWVGCWGAGLYVYDNDMKPLACPAGLEKICNGLSIWGIHEDEKEHRVWLAMQTGEIIVYNSKAQKYDRFSPDVFKHRTIRQVTGDKEGNIWFGTQGGHIVKWDRKVAANDVRKGYRLVAKERLVHKLLVDKDGFVWVATSGAGLFKIDAVHNRLVQHFSKQAINGKRLWTDAPYDILQYNDSTLLLANGALDIINMRTQKVTSITTENGLPSNSLVCLEKDEYGILWLGTSDGLYRFNVDMGIFTRYDRRDGIAYDNLSLAGAARLQNGRLAYATDHNLLLFDPAHVHAALPPDAIITDFKLQNRSLPVDSLTRLQHIALDYNQNSMAIEFSAFDFLKRSKLHYYYQLEGLEKEWKDGTDIGQAIYSYLPPGSYRFRVKCVNSNGDESKNSTALLIRVSAPFWQAWWFYASLLLLVAVFFYWIDRERLAKLLSLQQVRIQIARNLHQDLSVTLNNINLLSEIAKMKADKDVTRSKEYIDQISDKSRRMIDAMDDILWSILPENDSMEKTLERMSEFTEGIRQTHDIAVTFSTGDKVRSLKLDMKARHEMYLIFREALQNMAQQLHVTNVAISIDYSRSKSRLFLKIKGSGTGFDDKNITVHQNLHDMQKRAAALNALLDVQTDHTGMAVILVVTIV